MVLTRLPLRRETTAGSETSSILPRLERGTEAALRSPDELAARCKFKEVMRSRLLRWESEMRTLTGISSVSSRIEPPTKPFKLASSCWAIAVGSNPASRACSSSTCNLNLG